MEKNKGNTAQSCKNKQDQPAPSQGLWITRRLCLVRHTESNCQTGPVSQNQIRQREHDVEFGLLFSEPSVSRFLEF